MLKLFVGETCSPVGKQSLHPFQEQIEGLFVDKKWYNGRRGLGSYLIMPRLSSHLSIQYVCLTGVQAG